MKKVLECSRAGDTRFSAFVASVTLTIGGRTKTQEIEKWYQLSKRFGKTKPRTIAEAKGKSPTHIVIGGQRYQYYLLTQWYKLLWLKYLDDNPKLVKIASRYDVFTDKFKGKRTVNCQADVIAQYVKQGRDSIIQECLPLLHLMEGWDLFMATKPKSKLPLVNVWTDGACSGNGTKDAIGAWAYIVEHQGVERSAYAAEVTPMVTCNQMELTAVLKTFERYKTPCQLVLHTDSEYVERAFNEGRLERWQQNGWRTSNKKRVANVAMWRQLLALIKDGGHELRVIYKSDEADANIQRCHQMATQAVKEKTRGRKKTA